MNKSYAYSALCQMTATEIRELRNELRAEYAVSIKVSKS